MKVASSRKSYSDWTAEVVCECTAVLAVTAVDVMHRYPFDTGWGEYEDYAVKCPQCGYWAVIEKKADRYIPLSLAHDLKERYRNLPWWRRWFTSFRVGLDGRTIK